MFITALTLAVTVFVLRLYHTEDHNRPPVWLRYVVYSVPAKLVCMAVPKEAYPDVSAERKASIQDHPEITPECEDKGSPTPRINADMVSTASITISSDNTPGDMALAGHVKAEYVLIARVVDKFFSGLFFCLLVIGTLSMLCFFPLQQADGMDQG